MDVISQGIQQLGFDELSADSLYTLISCKVCGDILNEPVTTRCGISCCRPCILSKTSNEHTTAAACPIDQCRQYEIGDCPIDVKLRDVVNAVSEILKDYATALTSPDASEEIHSDNINRLAVVQERLSDPNEKLLDCAICYDRFLYPVTMRCGHTFCRHCLQRRFDEDLRCPLCARLVQWPFKTGAADHHDPLKDWSFNHHIASIISTCWRPWVAIRQSEVDGNDSLVPSDMDIPVFVCTTSYPKQPTFLRIFEPRYRRLLRRVLETEARTFGMADNPVGLHSIPFAQYGTIIRVEWVEHREDQQIIIKTTGVARFKVKRIREWDQYWTACVDEVSDLDDADITRSPAMNACLISLGYHPGATHLKDFSHAWAQTQTLHSRLTNTELTSLIRQFVDARKSQVDPEIWELSLRNLGPPPTDDNTFVWWFARLMHLSRNIGLRLLMSTNLRERLRLLVWYIMNNMPNNGMDNCFPGDTLPT
jgi:Lon protease-like protein